MATVAPADTSWLHCLGQSLRVVGYKIAFNLYFSLRIVLFVINYCNLYEKMACYLARSLVKSPSAFGFAQQQFSEYKLI